MEWIQTTTVEAWDRENKTKDSKDPSRLELDPVSHLPAQPYLKQEPIYATADIDSANMVPELNSVRKRTSDSLPNESRVPGWRPGSADQRYRTEQRQRVATVSGSRMEPTVSQRQYPLPSGQNARAQGREGREIQGSTSQGAQGTGERYVRGSAGQVAHGRGGREVQGSAGQGAQGRGREVQGSISQGVQGRGGRGLQGSAGQVIQGREVQGSTGQPNVAANYPVARFEKDYYVLDV